MPNNIGMDGNANCVLCYVWVHTNTQRLIPNAMQMKP